MTSQSSRDSARPHLVAAFAITISSFLLTGSFTGLAKNSNVPQEKPHTDQIQKANKLLDESWQLREQGRLSEAITAAEASLEIIRSAVGPADVRVAVRLRDLGSLYLKNNEFGKAEQMLTQSLSIMDRFPELNPRYVTNLLSDLGNVYLRTFKYMEARKHFKRLVDIYESEINDDLGLALASLGYADSFFSAAEYTTAKPHYQRALELTRESTEPYVDAFRAGVSSRLGLIAFLEGKREEALRFLNESAPVLDAKLPVGREYLGLVMLLLGGIYEYERGESVIAEPLYERSLKIMEDLPAADQLFVTVPLLALATLRQSRGDYPAVERLLFRAFSIFEKAPPPVAGYEYLLPSSIFIMNGLGNYYLSRGEIDKAEAMVQRGLAILEKRLGEDHIVVGHALVMLSSVYALKKDDAAFYRNSPRIIAIFQKALTPATGATVFQTQTNQTNAILMAGMGYLRRNDTASAESLVKSVLVRAQNAKEILEESSTLSLLKAFGVAYRNKGDYAQAETLFQSILEINQRAYGRSHPEIADIKNHLAILYNATGETDKAIAAQAEAINIRARDISQIITTGSERQKLLYFNTILREMYGTISLHIQSAFDKPSARDLAFETILSRKALALDGMVDTIAPLRRRLNEQDGELLEQWLQYRSDLATLVRDNSGISSTDDRRQRITRLEDQIEKLESDLSARSSEFRTADVRAQSYRVRLKDVQAAIPSDSVLVEFIVYHPFDARSGRWGPPRYAAYILSNQGESKAVDVGPLTTIDTAINDFSEALREESKEVKRLGRALDELCMQQVRKHLGNARHIIVSPDGALNTVPFEALVDENNNYLIDVYAFTYLTTGRDLLRFRERVKSREGAVVVIDPAYDARANGNEVTNQVSSLSPAEGIHQGRFPLLSGGEDIANTVKELFPQTRVLSSNEATETALKLVKGPFLLHISTHGFFDQDIIRSSIKAGQQPQTQSESAALISERLTVEDNPLFRSGLALAGANRRTNDTSDGILTAYELALLDLWGTRVVVLSACETARGDVKNGNGVFGLRRSLVIAGSEAQVISLWQVDKLVTGALIETYYRALSNKMGRAAALQYAQKQIRKRREHPYFWAPFIQSGMWSDLSEN